MFLATIGYEGINVEAFFNELKRNGIKTIVDIRELPISRKSGFSKSALTIHASSHNIRYVHIPELGCPKEIRHKYKENKDWALYTRKFRAYLHTKENELLKLAEMVQLERCCLLCFEADYFYCHRRYVVDELQLIIDDLDVKHLVPTGKASAAWLNSSVGIPLQ